MADLKNRIKKVENQLEIVLQDDEPIVIETHSGQIPTTRRELQRILQEVADANIGIPVQNYTKPDEMR